MVYRIDETTMAKSIAVLSLISLTDSDLIIAVTTRDFYTNSLRHIIHSTGLEKIDKFIGGCGKT